MTHGSDTVCEYDPALIGLHGGPAVADLDVFQRMHRFLQQHGDIEFRLIREEGETGGDAEDGEGPRNAAATATLAQQDVNFIL